MFGLLSARNRVRPQALAANSCSSAVSDPKTLGIPRPSINIAALNLRGLEDRTWDVA